MRAEVPADEEIEYLVGATKLYVATQGHRIVALYEGIEEFVDADGEVILIAVLEVFPLEHAGYCVMGAQADHVSGVHRLEPLAVEAYLRLFRIEDLEHLSLVRLGVLVELLPRKDGPRLDPSGRIADHARKIADKKDRRMAEFLKLLELLENHRMAEVQIRCGRVHAQLYAERPLLCLGLRKLLLHLVGAYEVHRAALDDLHLLVDVHVQTIFSRIRLMSTHVSFVRLW